MNDIKNYLPPSGEHLNLISKTVIVVDKYGEYTLASYQYENGEWRDPMGGKVESVTHWANFPELPYNHPARKS